MRKNIQQSNQKKFPAEMEVIEETEDMEDDDDDSQEDEGNEEIEDESGNESESEDTDEDNEDLYVLNSNGKDHTRFPEGRQKAKIIEVKAKKVSGPYGKYVRMEVEIDIVNNDTREILRFKYYASKTSSRMYDFAAGILGQEPGFDFNFKSLENKITYVVIAHRENDKGEIWDQIVETDYYEPKNKRAR